MTRHSRTETAVESSAETPVGEGAADRRGTIRWRVVAVSVLSSTMFAAAVGCVSAFIYPIIKELQAGTVRGVDGTEERILGFWSILVLSVLAGSICAVFSWTITYLDSYQVGTVLPTPLALFRFRDAIDKNLHIGYAVAIVNGFMAMLTVIWSLT